MKAMNMHDNFELGTLDPVNLLKILKNAKYTQSQIGEMLGCSQGHVCNVKKGKASFSEEQIRILRQEALDLRVNQKNVVQLYPVVEEIQETDEEMSQRIEQIFDDMESFVELIGQRQIKALLIDGAPGVGKSYTVESVLNNMDVDYTSVKGTGTTPSLYQKLYENRDGILVIDDCDTMFNNEESLNILKAALDTIDGPRMIHYEKKAPWLAKEDIPSSFEFNGSVIVISNLHLDEIGNGNAKIANHVKALLSRSLHINMEMKTRREILCRIEMIADSVLEDVSAKKKRDILNFFRNNMENFKEFSLRELVKLKDLACSPMWERLAARSFLRSKNK